MFLSKLMIFVHVVTFCYSQVTDHSNNDNQISLLYKAQACEVSLRWQPCWWVCQYDRSIDFCVPKLCIMLVQPLVVQLYLGFFTISPQVLIHLMKLPSATAFQVISFAFVTLFPSHAKP